MLMSDNPYKTPEAVSVLSDVGGADPKLEKSVSMLRQTRPWVRLVSVVMFLVSFMMMAGGLFMVVGALGGVGGFAGGVGTMVGVVYSVMAMLYIAPAVFLWKYANRIGIFVSDGSTGSLASALESQKSFWKFVGIAMLVVIAFYAMIFVFTIIAAIIGLAAV
jgi:hypothetical protein